MADIWNRISQFAQTPEGEELLKTLTGAGGHQNPPAEALVPAQRSYGDPIPVPVPQTTNIADGHPALTRVMAPPPSGGMHEQAQAQAPAPAPDLAPAAAPAPLTGSAAIAKEYSDAANTPADIATAKKKGWWRRLGTGAKDAYLDFKPGSQSGGLGGLISSVLEGGISEAASPKIYAEDQKNRGLSKIWNRYGQQSALEESQIKQQGELDKQKADRQKAAREAADPLYKVLNSDDNFSPADSAEYFKQTGIYIPATDASKRDLQWVNGKPLTRRDKGSDPYVRDASLPDKTEDVPHDTTIQTPSGAVTLPLKPGQAASTLVQAQARADKMAADVQKRADDIAQTQYTSRAEFQKALRDWSKDDVAAMGKKAKAEAALPKLEKSRQDILDQQGDTAAIDKTIAELTGDVAEGNVWIANRDKTKPKYEAPPGSKTSKGGKNNNVGTEDDYQRALKKLKGH